MTTKLSSKLAAELSKLDGARRALVPNQLAPMLATTAAKPGSRDGWMFEPKLDGIRCVAIKKNGQVRLQSRRGLDLTGQYPQTAQTLHKVMLDDSIIDGEIVALDRQGRPSFQLLQQRMNLISPAAIRKADETIPVAFFAFDVVHHGEWNLCKVPLRQRKEILPKVFLADGITTQVIASFDGNGDAVYQACVNFGFEGIVGKRAESCYEPGRRSHHWVKVKPHKTSEFVVAGYTRGEGGRNHTFGALLLGQYDDADNLLYRGSVGSGFNERQLVEIRAAINELEIKKCPFKFRPADKPRCAWLTPLMVAEVKFLEWTQDLKLRAPVFLRFRPDVVHTDVR